MRRQRGLTAIALSLFVSACVSFPDAPAAIAPAVLTADALRTPDGALLPVTVWAADEPKAVLLAVHGMNDYANAFALPGAWWAERARITTYAIDQRGFGGAPGIGRWHGAETMKADLRAAVAAIRAVHRDTPLYVLGHSMGAAVALAAQADAPLGADGLILAAPGVWGGSALPWTYRLSANLAAAIAPGKTLTGERAGRQASDNIEILRAMGADPKVIKTTRVDTVLGLVRLMGEAFERADAACADALILIGARDEIIPNSAMEHVAETYCGEVSIRRYRDGWHMLFRDNQRKRVWRDISAWLDARPAPTHQRAGPGAGKRNAAN